MNEPCNVDPRTIVPLQGVLEAPMVWYYRAVPFRREGTKVFFAMDDPTEIDVIDSIIHRLRCDVEPVKVTTEELNAIMRRFYGSGEVRGMCLRQEAIAFRNEAEHESD